MLVVCLEQVAVGVSLGLVARLLDVQMLLQSSQGHGKKRGNKEGEAQKRARGREPHSRGGCGNVGLEQLWLTAANASEQRGEIG